MRQPSFTQILAAPLALAVAAATLALGAPAWAQGTAPAAKADKTAPAETPVYGHQLMTPAERSEMQQKMRAAKTPDERAKLRAENHAKMTERATEQGVTLTGPRGTPQLYGQQLMTPEERTAHMDKMRAATTREERVKLRDEHRAEMQKRAQEKGITLPPPGSGMGGMGPGKGGMKGSPGGGGAMGGPGGGGMMGGPGGGGMMGGPGGGGMMGGPGGGGMMGGPGGGGMRGGPGAGNAPGTPPSATPGK